MAIGAAIAAVVGAVVQSRSASRASKRARAGQQAAIDEQRAARQQFLEGLQPFTEFGLEARDQLRNLLSDPTAGLEQINPIVDILRNQGFEQIQESAAAGGRLGAGGTLRDLTQFNTDLATTVIPQLQNQRFNQLFNVLSLGQASAAGQGAGLLSTAGNISNRLGNIGTIGSEGAVGQSNIITNLLGNLTSAFGANTTDNTLVQSDVDEVFSGELF